MSSGLYSALSAARSRMALMDTITENLANVKTAGFKKGQSVFESMLDGARAGSVANGMNFAKIKGEFTDFTQGVLTSTGVPSHLGINGEGFFKVKDADGNIYYTRQGNLRRDLQFNLVTADGMQVLGEGGRPINLPGNEFTIDKEGNVTLDNGGTSKIPLFTFEDTAVLQRRGGGLFFPVDGSQDRQMDRPQMVQGHVEESNVKTMEETGRMMEALRTFEAGQKAIQTYDKLASKADELGSVG